MIKKGPKKISAAVFAIIMSVSLLAMPQSAKAFAYSWPDIIGFSYKQMLEQAYDIFKSTMVAQLKTQAARMLQSKLQSLLMQGNGGRPYYISDYRSFIYSSSRQNTRTDVNNFYRNLQSGSSSQTGSSLQISQRAVENEIFNIGGSRPTLDRYVNGGVNNLFNTRQGGGFSAFNAAFDLPSNNNFMAAYINGERYGLSKMGMYQDVKRTEAIAGRGYESKKDPKTNLIKMPGSNISDVTSKTLGLPLDMVAVAHSIPEVLATLASQMLGQMMQTGFNQLSRPIDNQLRNLNMKVYSIGTGGIGGGRVNGVGDIQRMIYTGIKFTK